MGIEKQGLKYWKESIRRVKMRLLDAWLYKMTTKKSNKKDQAASDLENGFYGDRVRLLRKTKGKTLTQLANETNLSSGYISQIERGLAFPSVAALVSIAKVLGVNAQHFFADAPEVDETEIDYVVRSDKRLEIKYENGVLDQLLTPKSNKNLQLIRCKFPPGGGSDTYTHKGHEVLLVEQGSMEFWVDGRHFVLNAGDTLSFESNKPHRYINNGDSVAIVYWFITPASF
ncbi:helix-turn-helix domain-containing protein [Terasakiella pusilla]|uniref:helix-turn-helix domain-containing protein n=1 Tax=Terasakiella pusilla TaxID=64973 RepID=UPI0012EC30B1|nr:cupin domain-containing protein [Terasakiella pusilla]